MTVSEVLALLDAERDERRMTNWEKLGSSTMAMRSYGIGLTRLRKPGQTDRARSQPRARALED